MNIVVIPKSVLRDLAKTKTDIEIGKILGCGRVAVARNRKEYDIPQVYEYRRAKNGYKVCKGCNERKPTSDFTVNRANLDGFSRRCRVCRHAQMLKYRRRTRYRTWAGKSLSKHKWKGFTVEPSLSTDFLEDLAMNTERCSICGVLLSWDINTGYLSNSPTLDRIDNGQVMGTDSIQILCRRCNITKYDRTMNEFVEYCRMVVEKYDGKRDEEWFE